jgi:hypothetical protein
VREEDARGGELGLLSRVVGQSEGHAKQEPPLQFDAGDAARAAQFEARGLLTASPALAREAALASAPASALASAPASALARLPGATRPRAALLPPALVTWTRLATLPAALPCSGRKARAPDSPGSRRRAGVAATHTNGEEQAPAPRAARAAG